MSFITRLALGAVCLLSFISAADAAVTLTTFGSTSSPTFSIDTGNTGFSTVQNASSLQISGSDQTGNLAGGFNSVSIVGDTSLLTLTGSTTSAPSSQFSITLFDASFNQANYIGGTWTSLTGGSTTLTYTSVGSASNFDFAHVIGMGLNPGGTGNTVNATLTGLSAGVVVAPEPTRVMLAFFGLGAIAFRRRR